MNELVASVDGAAASFERGVGAWPEGVARMGTWAYAPALEQLVWSENQFRLWGLEPASSGPTLATLVSLVHADDRELIKRGLANTAPSAGSAPISYRVVLPDGRVRHHEAGAVTIRETRAAGVALLGFIRDITDLRTVQREITARNSVSHALDRWQDPYRGPELLLGSLAQALGCERAVFWVVADGVLKPRVGWQRPGSGEEMRELAGVSLAPGQGVAGRAWATRAVVTSTDGGAVEIEDNEPLAAPSVRQTVAIPAVADNEVLAVVALASGDELELDEPLTATLTGISSELGYFLARRRGELAEPVLTARELQVLELASAGYSGKEIAAKLFVSGSTIRTHFEHAYAKLGVHDRAAAVAKAMRDGFIG